MARLAKASRRSHSHLGVLPPSATRIAPRLVRTRLRWRRGVVYRRAAQRARLGWGLLGAASAAWFAVWFLFFPQFVSDNFAWDIEPRFAQAFIGAGYVFRTAFFLNAAFERSWLRLRWIVWGNLVFTGTLLLATYWHAEQFHWNPFETPLAHIWSSSTSSSRS